MHKTHKKHHFTSQFCHAGDTTPMSFPRRRESSGRSPHNEFLIPGCPTGKGMTRSEGQSGRSMVEMLGVLAIIGVLSAGAIGGYSYAMNKHRTNELIYEATKRAQWVGTQLEMNKNAQNIGFGGFGTDEFGGGKFTGTVKTDLAGSNQFGIVVSGLKEAVCENIVKGLETETNSVIRAVLTTDGTTDFDRDNCDDNAEFLLVFNRDLSTSDSEVPSVEPEVSGEASASAGAVTEPATQNPDDEHCSGNGSWNGSSCYCDNGWQGDNCSEEEPESSEPATAQSGEDHTCSGHGTWYQWVNNYAGGCECNSGWGGSDCSEDHTNDCGEHGYWSQSNNNGAGGCSCDSGWEGDDCSGGPSALYCNSHGIWCGSFCECDSGWGGSDCSKTARAACADHGVWHSSTGYGSAGGYCECDSGYTGADCSTPL